MADGPANYSRLLQQCPPQLAAAFTAAETLLKKVRGLRNKGRATDQDVESARQAWYLTRDILTRENWRNER